MVRLIAISDLHLQRPALPVGDILIVAGDSLYNGSEAEFYEFLEWIKVASRPFKHTILIGGNHDNFMEQNIPLCKDKLAPIHFLCDEGITLEGIKFWGSPVVPFICGTFAWERHRGRDIANHWRMVPENTDVLITHTAPAHLMGARWGCQDLLYEIERRIDCQYVISGHEHSLSGRYQFYRGVHYYSVAICNPQYLPTNPATVIDYEA